MFKAAFKSAGWAAIAACAAGAALLAVLGGWNFSRLVAGIALAGGAPAALLLLASPIVVFVLAVRGILRSRSHVQEMRVRLKEQREANALAKLDPLTGLLNRRGLLEEVQHLADDARQTRKALALMVLDLDEFKMVNDIHGHLAGDALIREVANRIADCCPEGSLAARMGGDEFAIALHFEADFPVVVDAIANEILLALAQECVIDTIPLHVGASIGIARMQASDTSINGMLREADVAMYRAKQDGRNCFRWFDLSMEEAIKERSQIEAELRQALQRAEIVPYYEPQIDLATGEITGFEVLARWNHPAHGLVLPSRFIAVAEESGQIGELSYQLVRQAMIDALAWDPAITLAVNISPFQLRDPDFAQRLLKLFVEVRFPPQRLEVEITESALLSNLDTARAAIVSLKNQGVRLSLDDFGTGYSSLHHLRALPFDRIKIDRSFISSLLDSSDSVAIVTAVLGLGRNLGIEVTAEGIETVEIEERLRALDCPMGQGWLYSKPVSSEDALRLLHLSRTGDTAGHARQKRAMGAGQ